MDRQKLKPSYLADEKTEVLRRYLPKFTKKWDRGVIHKMSSV